MRKTKEWSTSEIETLWIYYPYKTNKELTKIFPDRSEGSIRGMAGRMRLVKSKETRQRIGRQNANIGYVDEYPDLTKEFLQKHYVEEKKSTREVARMVGCHNTLVVKRLRKHGLPVRKRVGDPAFTPDERKAKWGRPGELHPNWKGGITEVSNVIRNRIAHVSLEAFKRDGFACTECGGGEHELNAHHIKPFSEIVAEIREENGIDDLMTWEEKERLADICEQDERLLDVDNLITLCEECHYEVHHGDKSA